MRELSRSVRICVLRHKGGGDSAAYMCLNGKVFLSDIEEIYVQYSGHPL